MKVKDLIQHLQQFPEDAIIAVGAGHDQAEELHRLPIFQKMIQGIGYPYETSLWRSHPYPGEATRNNEWVDVVVFK
jgi:hypothetical protein